ncbi:MAG: fumarate hydratase [Candidatus Thermoplasmatota archaeon]
MEYALVERLNSTDIGPIGLGDKTTILDVHVKKHRVIQ